MTPSTRRVAVVLAAAALVGGCGRTVTVSPLPIASPSVAAACAQVVAALPDALSVGRSWPVSPDPRSTAAWASPAVVLRCGSGVPGPDPTDQLLQVDGVPWVVTSLSDGEEYRTADREPGVIVTVPSDYAPTAAILAEVAPAVAAGTAAIR
jgi:hypothetical protein